MLYSLGNDHVKISDNSFVAPDASVIGTVILDAWSSIWFNAVLRGDGDLIQVGENSNIQDSCVVHADPGIPVQIDTNVTVGHKVMLHGCHIGSGSLIGINSVILNNTVIGKECLIGANTLLTEGKRIPDRSMVLGSPGKVVRQLSEAEVAGLQKSAAIYVEKAKRYLRELKVQSN